ncbi:MAG: response regulator [Lachnospiraceae bacterium]|nr:response regulator [Lachnospiraceae bacterium]
MASVLIADDAIFMRATIKQMLDRQGHVTIAEASDGAETIEKFVETKPDIIILDITMPGMNGIEALKRIRELDRTAKIIICSAIGQQEIIAKAIQCGASDFIVKPFEASQLLEAIEKVMRE